MVSRTVVFSYFTLATVLVSVKPGNTQDEAPSFLKEPISQVVQKHSKVNLKCEFLPKDAVHWWTFDGEILDNTSVDENVKFRDRRLFIKSFQNYHAGNYKCYVRTSIGLIVSRTAKLQVAYIRNMGAGPELQSSVHFGETAVMKCTPPDSKPKAVLQFLFNGNYIDDSSGRHSILASGYLVIHNVTTKDEGVYTCRGYNTVIKRYKTAEMGTNLTIQSDSGGERSMIVTGASVFIGENAVLGCISWDFQVQWFRSDDAQMPDKVIQQMGNLYIENVRKHDMGFYTCKSYLEDGSMVEEKTVHLEVKIRPAIRNPPKDTSSVPGVSLSLKCSVVGDDKEIQWLFNAVPIDPVDTDYIADGRQLKIGSLKVKHLGMYQCYVENELGSAQSSAQVKFSRGFELPSFTRKPENMTAIEEEEVFFVCGITGQPEPFMYWLNPQNKRIYIGNRFTIDGEPTTGGLAISYVQPEDAGWYTCIVKNAVGEASTKAYLNVIGAVKFPAPTKHTPMPTIQPIEGAVSDEAQIDITNNVQIPVKNGSVPNRPGKPTVTQVTASSVDIWWTYEDDSYAPASEFYIQRLVILGSNHWTNTSESIPVNKLVHRVVDLTPDTTYRFRVFAANRFGSSQPSEPSHRFLVGAYSEAIPRKPVEKPIITRCEADSTTSIIVEWEYKIELETQPVDGFYIYHKADTDEDDYQKNSINDPDIARYVIKNLQTDMLYDIKMQTFNIAGNSGYSNIMSVSTDAVNVALTSDFTKPVYKPPVTPKSPVDVPIIANETPDNAADKEEILYICIGVVLGTLAIIFIMFAGMCIWRSRQPNGMFGAMNWSHGYYGGVPPYSKGSQDFNNRYMNGCPVYDQQYQNGVPYRTHNGHLEPRPLYMMPQDTEMPIEVSQYFSAEQNEVNQNRSTILGSQNSTLDRRHPSCVRPVKREDLKLTPNGIVCRPIHSYSRNGDVPCHSNGDIHSLSSQDIRYHSNSDVQCQTGNNQVDKDVARKASYNSLTHNNIAEDQNEALEKTKSKGTRQRTLENSEGDTSNEDTMSRSSANSSHSTHSIVESDV